MSSQDQLSKTFIYENSVLRAFTPESSSSALKILDKIKNHCSELGIIPTEIASEEDIGKSNIESGATLLRHKKIEFVSYPHEWSPSMLKRAAIFQIQLFQDLFTRGLFLKDAHPWNILFEYTRPVFVDFSSIVDQEMLFNEEYLKANRTYKGEQHKIRLAMLVHEIFTRTYLPYFFDPLAAYAYGNRNYVRETIEEITLNSSTSLYPLKKLLPSGKRTLAGVKKMLKLASLYKRKSAVFNELEKKHDIEIFLKNLRQLIESMPVESPHSAYQDYYKAKGEDFAVESFSENWTAKQKRVYEAIVTPSIHSVVDVACNTGWYARMAAAHGKQVLAFDIDESCIESLYRDAQSSGNTILPLIANFLNLSKDRYSLHDGRKILISAEDRFKCDAVLALAVIHHLVLGAGKSIEDVIKTLAALARKRLVMEFVDITDPLIINELSFFPAFQKNPEIGGQYHFDNINQILRKYFRNVEAVNSAPNTRTIFICDKN